MYCTDPAALHYITTQDQPAKMTYCLWNLVPQGTSVLQCIKDPARTSLMHSKLTASLQESSIKEKAS